jgi:hypothetical protein
MKRLLLGMALIGLIGCSAHQPERWKFVRYLEQNPYQTQNCLIIAQKTNAYYQTRGMETRFLTGEVKTSIAHQSGIILQMDGTIETTFTYSNEKIGYHIVCQVLKHGKWHNTTWDETYGGEAFITHSKVHWIGEPRVISIGVNQ